MELAAPVALTHFTLASSGDSPQRDPRVFQILGSNNGTDFTPIYSRNLPNLNIFDARYQVVKFNLPAPSAPYTWIRYSVTGTNSNEHALAEIEYFGATDTTTDTDTGGIPDYYEDHFPDTILDKTLIADDTADYDMDGLNNLAEFQNGTNPDGVDTDGDGLTDGQEVNGVVVGTKTYTSNPLSQDTDGDGLLDGDEVNGDPVNGFTSDPDDTDTDDDGYADGLEIAEGSDPDDDTSKPNLTIVSVLGTNALLGGDITDPEDDGIQAANPANPLNWSYLHNWNWADISATSEANFSHDGIPGNQAAYDIFDNIVDGGKGKWCCNGPPQAVTLRFLAPYAITHFTLTSSNDSPQRDPRTWAIQGSNDGTSWTDIYPLPGSNDDPSGGGSGLWTARNQTLLFELPTPSANYKWFRYDVTATNSTQHALAELELFGTRDDTDTDSGGVPDWFEVAYGLDPDDGGTDDVTDIDLDGLTSLEEYNLLSNPLSELGTNPNLDDTDGDGIKDGEETIAGADGFVTNPFNPDTDGDGMPDGWETTYTGLDPTVDDAAGDLEPDNLDNLGEFNNGTDPTVVDSDGDTLGDGAEVNGDPVNGYTSDPAVQDTDGDGLRDDAEVNGDPVYGFTSNPALADTDGDQYPDAFEVFKGTDPDDALDFPALDPITWGPAQDITGNLSDIDGTGTLVHAWNGGASTINVGGTDFVPGPSLGSSATGIDPYDRLNDQDYEDLLDEVTYNGTVALVNLVEIPGLTIGATYQIQVWVADTRSGTENRIFTFDTVDPTDPSVDLNAGDAADLANKPGQFAIGTFTPNSTSAFLNVQGVGVGPHYTAIMVRRIGDPGPYYDWATGFTPFPGGPGDNNDGDLLDNRLEFGFGTNPIVSDANPLSWNGVDPAVPGTPVVDASFPGGGGVDFTARFMRRKDGSAAYTLEFSSDMTDWQTSDDIPAPAWYDPADLLPLADDAGGDYELVEYPYPLFFDGKKVRFFRVTVTAVP